MLKGNCRKKNLTTCKRKISSYKPALKKCVLQNFASFTGKHVLETFFNKVAGLHPASFLKRDSNTSAFL